jgi:hypothetical protein
MVVCPAFALAVAVVVAAAPAAEKTSQLQTTFQFSVRPPLLGHSAD